MRDATAQQAATLAEQDYLPPYLLMSGRRKLEKA